MTIAGKVFSQATTQTVHVIACAKGGKRVDVGYVFADMSVIRIDKFSIGYCAADKCEYLNT